MPRNTLDFEAQWAEKIREADEYHEKWERKYKVRVLEDYEEGFQTADKTDYVLNMFFSTIEVKSPALTFTRPIFNIKPKPQSIVENGEQAFQYAMNNEDLINTWVLTERNNVSSEIKSAIDDAWSRFGIIEVNYSADWIDNPKVAKQPLESDYKPGVDKRNLRKMRREPDQIPVNESEYLRNIPAEQFRVSPDDDAELHRCDWCGYWERVRIEDLLLLPHLINKEKLRQSVGESKLSSENQTEKERQQADTVRTLEFVRIWKVWDNRARRRYIFVNDLLAQDIEYTVFPFVELRFKKRKRSRGFYPLPLTFNWLHPQDELNEVRNAHRNHRRRFKRLYTFKKAAFEDESQHEIEKFINGPDGTAIGVTQDDPIRPVPNADLGASANISLQVTKDDFNIVSGTASEMRGEADRTTATQAALTNQRLQIRETKEVEQVAEFICRIAKKILTFFSKMNTGEVPVYTQPNEAMFENIQTSPAIRTIDPMVDLGDDTFDFALTIQLSAISPIANQEEKGKFIEFLTLLNQFPQFGLSPSLIRELAYRVGYYNEKVIGEFQQMAQLQLVGMMQQAQAALGQQGVDTGAGQEGQQRLAQMTPPTQEQVRQQLNNQGVPIQ